MNINLRARTRSRRNWTASVMGPRASRPRFFPFLHPGVAACAALLGLVAAAPLRAQSDVPTWPEITRESLPWTRWWWMGSAVDSANLSSELEAIAEAGFGGVEVTSIYGVHGYEHAFVPYLSDRWVDMLLHAATEAARLGLGIDMPPGSGWRTGGPGVPAADANASLHINAARLSEGEVWEEDLSDRSVDAVIAISTDGERVDLTERARGTTRATWRPPSGEWTVYVADTRFSGDSVKRPAPGGAGYSIDVFSRTAVGNFLDAYTERIERVPPGTLRAFFHDSFEYGGTGSAELFDVFRRMRGYDLKEHLPALIGEGDAEVVARVKSDYRQTLDDMLLDHFLRPLTAWSNARGSLSRNQAHGSPGNLLDLYAASDIPETEIFGPLDGPDADPLISKFASSAAHVAGKRLTAAEAMTWLGEHFTVTLDQVKEAVDQLFVSGVNHLIYHGTAYSPADAEWPGWLFYASTQFNRRNAIWRDLPALNRYVARVQSVLQSGVPDNDVLLYWPIHDNWHDADGSRIDFRVHRPAWFHEKPIGEVATALWRSGYGFDYVSDRLLAAHVVASEDGIVANRAKYGVIVVPRAVHMPPETLEKLMRLAEDGATIAFLGDLPADVPGLADLENRRHALASAKARIRFGATSFDGVREASQARGRVLIADRLEPLLRAAGVDRESVVDRGVQLIRQRHDAGHQYFIRHSGSAALDEWVPLAVGAAAAVIMDPLDGRIGVARSRTAPNGGAEVHLQLEPGASVVLRTFDSAIAAEPWPYRSRDGSPIPIQGTWDVEFVDGGPALPAPYRTDSPASWTERGDTEAERFAGTARYTIRFDAPADASHYLLDLGGVAESARVRLNDEDLGTLFARPLQLDTGPLRRAGNVLEIEVTNLSANRIRDLDRRGVSWKVFHDINFVGIDYRPFDASNWPVRPAGLLGPVTLQPLSVP